MIKQYEQFTGKFCTILTTPISFPFNSPKQYSEFLSGIVKEVSRDGILLEHIITHKLAFFNASIIVGIVEEQAIERNHPEYEKIRAELEQKKKPVPVQKPAAPTPQIALSIDELTRQAKQAKANQANTPRSS